MTWARFQTYFIKAGHLADTKLPRTKAAAKETEDTKKKGGKGGKDGKGGKGDTPKGAQAPGVPRADQGLPLPAKVLAMTTEERYAAARATNACLNCLVVGHNSYSCDRVRADGTLWIKERKKPRGAGVAAPATGVAAPATVDPVPPAASPVSTPPAAVGRVGVVVPFSAIGVSTTPAVTRPGVGVPSPVSHGDPHRARHVAMY